MDNNNSSRSRLHLKTTQTPRGKKGVQQHVRKKSTLDYRGLEEAILPVMRHMDEEGGLIAEMGPLSLSLPPPPPLFYSPMPHPSKYIRADMFDVTLCLYGAGPLQGHTLALMFLLKRPFLNPGTKHPQSFRISVSRGNSVSEKSRSFRAGCPADILLVSTYICSLVRKKNGEDCCIAADMNALLRYFAPRFLRGQPVFSRAFFADSRFTGPMVHER